MVGAIDYLSCLIEAGEHFANGVDNETTLDGLRRITGEPYGRDNLLSDVGGVMQGCRAVFAALVDAYEQSVAAKRLKLRIILLNTPGCLQVNTLARSEYAATL